MFVKTSLGERLTVIAVHPGVPGLREDGDNDGLTKYYDVLFVGTTRGRVLKLVNSARDFKHDDPVPVLIESIQVCLRSLEIVNSEKIGNINHGSDLEIFSFC